MDKYTKARSINLHGDVWIEVDVGVVVLVGIAGIGIGVGVLILILVCWNHFETMSVVVCPMTFRSFFSHDVNNFYFGSLP